jgi:hypothetical protein
MLACPECGASGDDLSITKLQIEINRVSYDVALEETPQSVQVLDGGETESECIDTDRDGAMFRCDGCYFETDDPEDFREDEIDTAVREEIRLAAAGLGAI